MGLFGGKKKTKEHDANSVAELLRLAEQYDTGNGVSMDRARATELYEQAAGMGDAKAQEALGGRYEEGVGTAVDLDKALFWYEQAVSGGRDYAAYSMAFLLHKLEKWDEAFQWAMIAANMGSVGAKRLLGRLYYNGTGTEKDIAEAVSWWESAAKEGDAQAARRVSSVFYGGELGTANLEKAYEYAKLAADAGDTMAYEDLGMIYKDGRFSGFDLNQAIYWYEKGAKYHILALSGLEELYYRLYFIFLEEITPEHEQQLLGIMDKIIDCEERMAYFPEEKLSLEPEKRIKQEAEEKLNGNYKMRDMLKEGRKSICQAKTVHWFQRNLQGVSWEEYNR